MKRNLITLAIVLLLMSGCSPMAATVGFQVWFPTTSAPHSAPKPVMRSAPSGQPSLAPQYPDIYGPPVR